MDTISLNKEPDEVVKQPERTHTRNLFDEDDDDYDVGCHYHRCQHDDDDYEYDNDGEQQVFKYICTCLTVVILAGMGLFGIWAEIPYAGWLIFLAFCVI